MPAPHSSVVNALVRVLLPLLLVQAGAAFSAEAHTPKTSPQFFGSFSEAMRALMEDRPEDAVSMARQVLGTPGRRTDDTHAAFSMIFQAGVRSRNASEMRSAFQGMLDTGLMPKDEEEVRRRAILLAERAADQ